MGLHMMGLKYGASLQLQGMNSLAGWLGAKGLPAITGLIVAKETRLPENMFFTAHGHDPDDFPWWEAEIARAKAYEWLSLEESLLPKKEGQTVSRPHVETAPVSKSLG